MARRMIPAKLEGQLQKFNSNISEDGKLYLDGIVDADGNQRFIEGDIIATESVPEGISLTYGKWSLSGTHLMFVAILEGTSETEIAGWQYLLSIVNMPLWIKNKILPLFSIIVSQNTFYWYANDGTNQGMPMRLSKDTSNNIYISNLGGLTLDKFRTIRVQFDLLIDAEAGE